MKIKRKSKSKSGDINIVIENNLLSKNKYDKNQDENQDVMPVPSNNIITNNIPESRPYEAPDPFLSEIRANMAQKAFYNMRINPIPYPPQNDYSLQQEPIQEEEPPTDEAVNDNIFDNIKPNSNLNSAYSGNPSTFFQYKGKLGKILRNILNKPRYLPRQGTIEKYGLKNILEDRQLLSRQEFMNKWENYIDTI